MKKIGIITINDVNNYGNRLQNYALQEKLKEISKYEVITIKNSEYTNRKENIIKQILRILKKFYVQIRKNISKERKRLFNEFNKNIKMTKRNFYWFFDKNIERKYDYFIVGSDQVWNAPVARFSDVDLLTFAPFSKRISYSASFGVSDLDEIFLKKGRENLLNFKLISVREEAGLKLVKKMTLREDVEILVDPTMLLTAKEWDKVSKRPKQLDYLKNKKYILNYFLGELSVKRKEEINRIAKENDCEIINILDKTSPFYKTGPSEFLYLEKNAFLICTDSFHSCVFSILYNRPFIVFDREDNNVKMNSRIETLISKFNLKNRKFERKICEENLKHDYSEAYQILEKEREKSYKFLKKALDITDKSKCCGCQSCFSVCPKNAIEMKEDDKGFKYPVIDKEKCINCGLCKKKCPIINKTKVENSPKAYACYNIDEEIRLKSSSGGIFTLIAEHIINKNGVVIGASFDEKFLVKHVVIENKDDLYKLRTSKYLQSNISDTYKQAKKILDEGRIVLFTGTPCQINGLLTFLGKEYDNLYTQDIICHGVPSPKVWKKYLEYRIKQDGNHPVRINFRQKDDGWNLFALLLQYNNSAYKTNHKEDLFFQAFLRNAILRDSCYNCSFKEKNRKSDITLADFWGIDNVVPKMNDDKGTSLVIINSLKGKELFENIEDNMVVKEVDFEQSIEYNTSMYKSVQEPKLRKEFFDNLYKMEFDELVKQYTVVFRISFGKKVLRK